MTDKPEHLLTRRQALLAMAASAPVLYGTSRAQTAETAGPVAKPTRILACNILLDLPEHKGELIDWNGGRREYCIEVIGSRKPDIICLQEVGRQQYQDFIDAFPEFATFGYDDPYVDKNPKRFQAAKNVIQYRRDRYELTTAGTYWLSDTPWVAGSRLEDTELPRHVTWVRLRDRATGRDFRVLNTHWALQQPIRVKSANIIAAETTPYAPDFPQLLAGDFNADRTTAEHKVLLDHGWQDTYEAVHGPKDPGRTGHGFKGAENAPPTKNGKIDFVFMRGKVEAVGAEILRDQRGDLYPSDHYFVSADVII